jgi:hypothetical protein
MTAYTGVVLQLLKATDLGSFCVPSMTAYATDMPLTASSPFTAHQYILMA